MSITVTEKAASEVKRIMEEQKNADDPAEKLYLRLGVVGGGCSGFKSNLNLVTELNPKADEVFDCHGISVVVDKRSLMYLTGATVDFVDEGLTRRGFAVHNPNARSTCGCGSSFSM